jgi:bifunctional N-acetylglucosamine-1-phosphate-uridyltransferase/glucosamine-1-phosphate-acetyltransferase GlmU-like protein
MNQSTGAIILAAGKGKRMNADGVNKVTLSLGNTPIIVRIVNFMQAISINTIVVVVGHQKESVMNLLKEKSILFAEQTEQLGTGHAVAIALEKLPEHITDVFVVYGDDAVFYSEQNRPHIQKLFTSHFASGAALSMLTIEQDNPQGLGRIVRDTQGHLAAIVEEKDATEEQKKITEINPGCFIFSVAFLKRYLPLIEKSPVTGEYYLTSLIDLAFTHEEKIQAIPGGKLAWRGVNTPEELAEAERIISFT